MQFPKKIHMAKTRNLAYITALIESVDCTNCPNLASCNIFYLWWQEWMGSGQSLINSSTNKLLHTMVTLASRAPSHNGRHTALTSAAPSHLHSSFSMDILTHLMQFDISASHKLS